MTREELGEHVHAFFGDRSRPAGETKSDLLDIAELCETLASTIPEDDDPITDGDLTP